MKKTDYKFIYTFRVRYAEVDAQGIVSASALSLIGGDVGGLHVAEGTVSVGEILKLKDSGQITGSQVLFTGGKIAAFNLSDDAFSTDTFFISASATGNDKFISTSNFNVKASGDITGSSALFNGNTRIEGGLDVVGTGTIASFGLTQTAISLSLIHISEPTRPY